MGRWANHRSFLFTMKGVYMIKVRSKTLFIPAEEQSIGAVGEADSTVREFHIDRVSGDGVDLANLLFKLNIRYAGVREIDRSDLEKVVTDNAIILRWLISSVTLRNAGTAFLQLDAFDETGSCRWKSYPGAVYIEKSIGTEDIPKSSLSELEQLEKRFTQIGDGEKARVEAEKKRVSAEEKREEAEGKRNTSLASIVAEEEKIKTLAKKTEEYKNSVLSDKEEIKAMKEATAALKIEAYNAKEGAKEHEKSAFAYSTMLRDEGDNLRTEMLALKEATDSAKEEAMRKAQDVQEYAGRAFTSADNASVAETRTKDLKKKVEERIQSAESTIQNQVMNATSYANMAERSSQQAEGYKMEAGVSAEKAKESETKTLEALKKAQEGGKGTLSYEVLKDEELDFNRIVTSFGLEGAGVPVPQDKLVTTNGAVTLFRAMKVYMNTRFMGLETSTDILSTYNNDLRRLVRNGFEWPAGGILGILRYSIADGRYAKIKAWDYIDIPTTIPGTENMRFYVMGIDRDESKNSIDFISFDYPERILMTDEELKKFGTANNEKILELVNNKIKSDKRLGELNESAKAGHISEIKPPYLDKKSTKRFHFWTISVGNILDIADSVKYRILEALESGDHFDKYELFNTLKYRRFMNKGKYLTYSCSSGSVVIIDEGKIPKSISLEDAFRALPQGTSQEDVQKLRPIIPICFRVVARE